MTMWICTKEIIISSKQKQKFYNKFIKSAWNNQKTIGKNLLLLLICIGNAKNKPRDLSEKLVINNNTSLEKQEIAEKLKKYFTNIGVNLVCKISNKQGGFEKTIIGLIYISGLKVPLLRALSKFRTETRKNVPVGKTARQVQKRCYLSQVIWKTMLK